MSEVKTKPEKTQTPKIVKVVVPVAPAKPQGRQTEKDIRVVNVHLDACVAG
jgi:hypothetical protein